MAKGLIFFIYINEISEKKHWLTFNGSGIDKHNLLCYLLLLKKTVK